jgi:hypothetical protein
MMPTPTRRDTGAWQVQVWVSFAMAASLCAVGLTWLPADDLDRAFRVMGCTFCLSAVFAVSKHVRDDEQRQSDTPLSGFTLQKTMHDRHEAGLAEPVARKAAAERL